MWPAGRRPQDRWLGVSRRSGPGNHSKCPRLTELQYRRDRRNAGHLLQPPQSPQPRTPPQYPHNCRNALRALAFRNRTTSPSSESMLSASADSLPTSLSPFLVEAYRTVSEGAQHRTHSGSEQTGGNWTRGAPDRDAYVKSPMPTNSGRRALWQSYSKCPSEDSLSFANFNRISCLRISPYSGE